MPVGLIDFFNWRAYGQLMTGGGMDSQPLARMVTMEECAYCYQIVKAVGTADSIAKYSEDNPDAAKYYLDVVRLRDEDDTP